jgi:hypothetical protein
MRHVLAGAAVLFLAAVLAAPAWAGETVEGRGYSIALPDGFQEVVTTDGKGSMHVNANFGSLPVKGMPELKIYALGSPMRPKALIVLASAELSDPVDSLAGMHLDDLQRRLPAGVTAQAAKIGKYDAIEVVGGRDGDQGTTRGLDVACGDYVVAVALITDDAAYPSSSRAWEDMKTSLKIDPPMSKLLLFGLIGLGALGALFLLSRLGTRPLRDVVDPTGRFQRFQDGGYRTGGGRLGKAGAMPSAATSQTPRQPRVLPSSRPTFDPTPGEMPSHKPTSPSVTRPARPAPPARPGLRPTQPASGRWGE